MKVSIVTIPSKKLGSTKDFYKVREIVGPDLDIKWDALFETKNSAIELIETVSGKKLNEEQFKNIKYGDVVEL